MKNRVIILAACALVLGIAGIMAALMGVALFLYWIGGVLF